MKLKIQSLINYKFNYFKKKFHVEKDTWSRNIESTIHQLSPYNGRLISNWVRETIEEFTSIDDWVYDPYCGSGVVALESKLLGRNSISCDLNPYATALTKGKLNAPKNINTALNRANKYFEKIETIKNAIDLRSVPSWVREFFHLKTLKETLALTQLLKANSEHFLLSCLLGILHHERPGFLSFPSSNSAPYLRNKKYPKEKFPDMYEYRDVESRLIKKIKRAYRRYDINGFNPTSKVFQMDCSNMNLEPSSIDFILTSPPYFGILDYARDNRLRLWFLGVTDYKKLDKVLSHKNKDYFAHIESSLRLMLRLLKPKKFVALVLGNINKNGEDLDLAERIAKLALNVSYYGYKFKKHSIQESYIPNERRLIQKNRNTITEKLLILQKIK